MSAAPVLLIAVLQVFDLGPPKNAPAAADRNQTGIHRALPAAALRRGKWTKLPGGSVLWRLEVRSPGAEGMRVHFRQFAAGRGQVSVSAGDSGRPQTSQPYTGAGPHGSGDFWSDIVFGERIVVEFRPGAGTPARGAPPFRIPEISHLR